jgi:hypothetical protein
MNVIDSLIIRQKFYYDEIDFIKALSIIAVIILHTLSTEIKLYILAPFHIWHAVPIFMMIAGMNSSLSILKRKRLILKDEYTKAKFKKYIYRLIVPFSLIWLIEIFALVLRHKVNLLQIFFSYITGGFGPGSYFTPLIIQHIILFPLIFWTKESLKNFNDILVLLIFFGFAIFLEWFCITLNVSDDIYKLLYVRYFFAAVLGSYLVTHNFKLILIISALAVSVPYIVCTSYLNVLTGIMIYPSWIFHHAPAYFFTGVLIVSLWKIFQTVEGLSAVRIFTLMGRASYHIFLFQMLYFWLFAHFIESFIHGMLLILVTNIFICLILGYAFFQIQTSLIAEMSRSQNRWPKFFKKYER